MIPNPLRDGSSEPSSQWDSQWQDLASDPLNRQCHVLDRLQPFQYKYKNTKTSRADAARTTVNSGVCKTARLSSTANNQVENNARCVRTALGTNQSTHICDNSPRLFTLIRRY